MSTPRSRSLKQSSSHAIHNSTPIAHSISSTQLEDYIPKIKVDVLAELMKRELAGAMFKVEDLANIVFPDGELPVPIMDTLIDAIPFKVPKCRNEA